VIRRKPGRSTSPQCVSTLSGWSGTAPSLGGVQMTGNWRYAMETFGQRTLAR